jgi:hypothetical protein
MVKLLQPSFASGEIAPALYGRVDVSKYAIALRTAKNALVYSSGGIANRSGTEFIGPAKSHNSAVRLIPFESSSSDTYALEFSNLAMRPIRNGGHVLESGKTISGATQANPVVITANSHGYSNGDEVRITEVVGMTQLNQGRFTIANVTTNTFQLTSQVTGANVNGSGFGSYTSGGKAERVHTVVTPYPSADLAELKYAQSGDILTLVHPSHDPRELSRTDHTVWSLVAPTFEPKITFPTGLGATASNGGSLNFAYKVVAVAEDTLEQSLPGIVSQVAISAATQANPVVITSSGHALNDGDTIHIAGVVGMTELNGRRFVVAGKTTNTFELRGEDGTAHTGYTSGGTFARDFTSANSQPLTDTDTITISWNAVVGAEKYDVFKEDAGIFGFIGSTTRLEFEDNNIAPDLTDTPPQQKNPFFGPNNKPSCVSFFQQRRVFGNTNNKPDTIFYTQTGHFNNFNVSSPSRDDDAITAALSALQLNEIRHFVPLTDLLVLTSGAEWKINAGSDVAFSITTLRQNPQTYIGSSHVPPLICGGAVLFVQDRGSIVRNLGYALESDSYTGGDMTILSSHLFEDKIVKEWGYQQIPHSIIWVVRDDGKLLTLTYNKEQDVAAWTRHETLGNYKSVCSVAEPTDVEDAVYLVVERTVNGNTVQYIERVHTRYFDDVRDCFFVDSGLTFDNPIAITGATSANPVVITANSHGFENGDEVDISDVTTGVNSAGTATGMSEINDLRFTVANKTTNTFELSGINGSAFTAYTAGGKVRKAVTQISGLDHLEGEAIKTLADGNVVAGLTVSNGAVTLTRAASRIHMGLGYETDLETLDLNYTTRSGTLQGRLKKVAKVVLRFEETRGGFVGPDFENLVEMKQREFELLGQPTQLITGDREVVISPDWNTGARIAIRQTDPLPLTLLAVVPDVAVGG